MVNKNKIPPAETAHYISEMLSAMRKMAKKEDMTFLVYLLDMAYVEAKEQDEMLKSD